MDQLKSSLKAALKNGLPVKPYNFVHGVENNNMRQDKNSLVSGNREDDVFRTLSGTAKPLAIAVFVGLLSACKVGGNGDSGALRPPEAESAGEHQPERDKDTDKGGDKDEKDSGGSEEDEDQTDPPALSGLPANGPEVLYAQTPDLPQLQNRDPRFRAAPLMVSGAERYIDGEYQYTDFVYDDDDQTQYPDDFDRYGGNAGDLFEFRISTRRRDSLGIRFTLNTLKVPDSTIIVLAFDVDKNTETGSDTLPRDPGMPFPGTDQVLTTWGTEAQWSIWNGSDWDHTSLEVEADLEANQITVLVPSWVADPKGQWLATLATGLYDSETGGWLSAEAEVPVGLPLPFAGFSESKIINLGFRFNENKEGLPNNKQRAALQAGTPTEFANIIDFDLLRNRGERDNIPQRGTVFRVYASRLSTVPMMVEGIETQESEGKNRSSAKVQYLSPLQPYVLRIPESYTPETPMPLTFALHGNDDHYYWISGTDDYVRQIGDDRNSIVMSSGSRSRSGFYIGDMEYDLLEAWNDVARHYTLDPKRTSVTGLSMGGYGTYRLALLYPHLFARAVSIAPAICRGIWFLQFCSDGEETVANRWVENARNLPIFHIADTLSEITPYSAQFQQVLGPRINELQSLDSHGYRYKFWSVAMDHILAIVGNTHPEMTAFLAQHEIEPEPFHVTYTRMPSNDHPGRALYHNRAYWLSDIEVRDDSEALAKGVIDVVSLGFGKADPTSFQTFDAGFTGLLFPYAETSRVWTEPGNIPVENKLKIAATNIASVTVDPIAARVDCDVELDIDSDGPIEVSLLGCEEESL